MLSTPPRLSRFGEFLELTAVCKQEEAYTQNASALSIDRYCKNQRAYYLKIQVEPINLT